MRKVAVIAALVAIMGASNVALANLSYPTAGGLYAQNFDTLPSGGATNTWTNNVTLPGWYAFNSALGSQVTGRDAPAGGWLAVTNIRGGTGSDTNGAIYSFGAASSTERALGSLGSNSYGDMDYVLVFKNDTGSAMTQFTLTLDGEQWRDRGGTANEYHKLVFDYAKFVTLPTVNEMRGDYVTGYTAVPALDFTGPKSTGAAGALDGNAAANRVAGITATVTTTWAAGEYLALRWWDDNDPGSDHGLGIDNLSFSATPEPATLVLLALGGLALLRRR
jgi:hypothetical protein